MKVSKSSEKAMLNTVRMLRRLLRKAFLVTNRVNVIGVLQGDYERKGRSRARPSPHSIDEFPAERHPPPIEYNLQEPKEVTGHKKEGYGHKESYGHKAGNYEHKEGTGTEGKLRA